MDTYNFGDDDLSEGLSPEERDDVIRRFRQRLNGDPGDDDDISIPNVEVLEELVEECIEEESFSEALRLCDYWLRFAPYSHAVWLRKGIVLTNLGRPEEALACYDHADTLHPSDIDTLIHRGVAFDALGLGDRALECFSAVLMR